MMKEFDELDIQIRNILLGSGWSNKKEEIGEKEYCVWCGISISSLDYEHKSKCKIEYEKAYKKKHRKTWSKNKRWKYSIKRLYNLKASQYYKLLRKQDYKCAICGIDYFKYIENNKNRKKLNIDHNHITGKVRGLLCHSCNVGISIFELPEERKIEMFNYLKQKNGVD